MAAIILNKYYDEQSVFLPENLLREARRQKNRQPCEVPSLCLLDPDGDLVTYLLKKQMAVRNECWACYHSTLYTFQLDGRDIGIVPCAVGASYAVLVAEQLFVSGCTLLLSVTSAGIIKEHEHDKRFALITSAVRDEGTSYHYLPADQPAELDEKTAIWLASHTPDEGCPFFTAMSWTTDAPYRETASAIDEMRAQDVACVEMEASALYALSKVKKYPIICFAHITNSMAQLSGDFEKGLEFGSFDTLHLVSYVLKLLPT